MFSKILKSVFQFFVASCLLGFAASSPQFPHHPPPHHPAPLHHRPHHPKPVPHHDPYLDAARPYAYEFGVQVRLHTAPLQKKTDVVMK